MDSTFKANNEAVLGEQCARDSAVDGFRDTLRNTNRWRTRDYIRNAQMREQEWLRRREQPKRGEILHAAVQALVKLMSTKGFRHSGLSVRPQDLYSGVHAGDMLHLLGQHPRLWRQIVLEGVMAGALLFEQDKDVAVVLVNPNPPRRTPRKSTGDPELRACGEAMTGAYPETFPGAPWNGQVLRVVK